MKALIRWLWVLPLLVALQAQGEVAIPPYQSRVTDLTGTLTASQRADLERALQSFESRKGSQIAVLMVPTTQLEAIEEYSLRVAETWKPGRRGVDDGILLVIAKDDRALRIEVGYGLEGVVPDAVAKRIVSEIIVPYFRQGDFYGGIQAGVDRIMRLIDGEPLPPPQARDDSWSKIPDLLPMAVIAAVAGGGLLRAVFGRLVGASLAGGIAGAVLWAILGSLFVVLLGGMAVFLFVLLSGSRAGRYGGWPGGGWGGRGSGGMGGGFGGGGGGGFGGGGASGKW